MQRKIKIYFCIIFYFNFIKNKGKNTLYTENLSIKILKELGIETTKNNNFKKTDVDLISKENIKIDVQYSQDFEKYKDLRVDFISAY